MLGFLLFGFVLRVYVAIKFSAKVDIDLFVHAWRCVFFLFTEIGEQFDLSSTCDNGGGWYRHG